MLGGQASIKIASIGAVNVDDTVLQLKAHGSPSGLAKTTFCNVNPLS